MLSRFFPRVVVVVVVGVVAVVAVDVFGSLQALSPRGFHADRESGPLARRAASRSRERRGSGKGSRSFATGSLDGYLFSLFQKKVKLVFQLWSWNWQSCTCSFGTCFRNHLRKSPVFLNTWHKQQSSWKKRRWNTRTRNIVNFLLSLDPEGGSPKMHNVNDSVQVYQVLFWGILLSCAHAHTLLCSRVWSSRLTSGVSRGGEAKIYCFHVVLTLIPSCVHASDVSLQVYHRGVFGGQDILLSYVFTLLCSRSYPLVHAKNWLSTLSIVSCNHIHFACIFTVWKHHHSFYMGKPLVLITFGCTLKTHI